MENVCENVSSICPAHKWSVTFHIIGKNKRKKEKEEKKIRMRPVLLRVSCKREKESALWEAT